MKETKNEPVVINILSTDSSLQKNEDEVKTQVVRKNFSSKFEPSPFGKFFGPRKERTAPVDMSNFSSWKNKNYRNAEKNIDKKASVSEKFSVADFLANNSKRERYNELDQAKSELQKPITQLSTEDPLYKRFSLDSFMHKLEEQTNVKDKFEKNDDILEPLGDLTEKVVPNSSQDENFGSSSDVDIEKVAFDSHTGGERFSFDRSELDKIRTRLDKIEKENANIKEKPTEKVITSELSDLTKGEDDEFDLSKLGGDDFETDDIDKVNEKLGVNEVEEKDKIDAPKIDHKKFIEVNKTEPLTRRYVAEEPEHKEVETATRSTNNSVETDSSTNSEIEFSEKASDIQSNDVKGTSENFVSNGEDTKKFVVVEQNFGGGSNNNTESGEPVDVDASGASDTNSNGGTIIINQQSNGNVDDTNSNESLKKDFKSITDEFMAKFTQMYKKDNAVEETSQTSDEGSSDESVEKINDNQVDESNETIQDENEESVEETSEVDENSIDEENEEFVDDGNGEFVDDASETTEQAGGITATGGTFAGQPNMPYGYPQQSYDYSKYAEKQNELQAKIIELIEQNKKADTETEAKLRQAELEKERVAKEYENRLKEVEENYKKHYEAFRQKAYLEKLDSDIKLQKAERDFKRREQKIKEKEQAWSKKQKSGEILRKELKSNISISNLEMEKKLFETISKKNNDAQNEIQESENTNNKIQNIEVQEPEEKKKSTVQTKPQNNSKTTKRRSTSSVRKARKKKMDSDIIGGIDFD
jgi:hypothetical protein